MPKNQANDVKLKPLHLYQANIRKNNCAFFFISDSKEKIWVKQAQTDWEEIKIDRLEEEEEENGALIYHFSGKEYNKLVIPCAVNLTRTHSVDLPYIKGKTRSDNESKVYLDQLLLSKKKLNDLGITQHLDLDLSDIPEEFSHKREIAFKARVEAQKQRAQYKSRGRSYIPGLDDMVSTPFIATESESKSAQFPFRLVTGTSFFSEHSAEASDSESETMNREELAVGRKQLTL